jgi:phage tail sheath protein FI
MPVTPTYPGIYIEELRSNTHTITAAPTSITVFVGYTHPFKTKTSNFNQAVEIFSFTDYEREFGGFYTSGVIDSNVPQAVNQFFLNGGSDAYVVGLKPHYLDSSKTSHDIIAATLPLSSVGITFTALEPVDLIPMKVTINNLQKTNNANDTADITITYGSKAETFRKVTLISSDKNYLPNRINDISSLVTVSISSPPVPSASFTKLDQVALGYSATDTPGSDWTAFDADDFTPVFAQDSSLDKVSIFNLLVLPGIADNRIWSEALAFCERKQAFLILDPPRQDSADGVGGLPRIQDDMEGFIIPKSTNGAIYFPYLKSTDSVTGTPIELPPSGFVAGIYARTDLNRGVWKAPAGLETTILNTIGVVERGRMTDQRQGTLNPIGVNCLRDFPGIGTVVFGARTLVSGNTAFQDWWYVPVRRMALFIEQTLYRNLGWVVFEPNDEPLWNAIRTSIQSFMLSLFNQGAFQGSTPSQAFQVKCDQSTTTQDDINNGIVNIVVAFAPLKPAEFVVIKIAQLAGQAQS